MIQNDNLIHAAIKYAIINRTYLQSILPFLPGPTLKSTLHLHHFYHSIYHSKICVKFKL